jgi:hypothetical protein
MPASMPVKMDVVDMATGEPPSNARCLSRSSRRRRRHAKSAVTTPLTLHRRILSQSCPALDDVAENRGRKRIFSVAQA